jgi:hypothetical protein
MTTLAPQADMDFFKGLKQGQTVTLHLAEENVRSFQWTHDHIEGDLIYGELSFDGYPERFPLQAYLYDSGYRIALGVLCFRTEKLDGEQVDFRGHATVFTEAPLPSQYRETKSGEMPKMLDISMEERRALDKAQDAIERAGFKLSFLMGGRRISDAYVIGKLKGCMDFELKSDKLRAHVSIRKTKRPGLFGKPNWWIWLNDDSNRDVQPSGWGPDGIAIMLGSTQILDLKEIDTVNGVCDSLLGGVDLLVTRNRPASD